MAVHYWLLAPPPGMAFVPWSNGYYRFQFPAEQAREAHAWLQQMADIAATTLPDAPDRSKTERSPPPPPPSSPVHPNVSGSLVIDLPPREQHNIPHIAHTATLTFEEPQPLLPKPFKPLDDIEFIDELARSYSSE